MASKIHFVTEIPDWAHAHPRKFLQEKFPNDVPGEEANILKHEHDLGCGAKVVVYAYGDHVFVDGTEGNENDYYNRTNRWNTNDWQLRDLNIEVIKTDEPFLTADVLGDAYTKTGEVKRLFLLWLICYNLFSFSSHLLNI